MPKRWIIVVSVAAAVLVTAAAVATVVAGKPEPACGCSIAPDAERPALAVATRFETLTRTGDVPGAWAMLTAAAQARYVHPAGFQPVFDRFGTALRTADAATTTDRTPPAATGWLPVSSSIRYDAPSDVVVLRPRLVWPLLVHVVLGSPGNDRIDPEPPALRLTAATDGNGVRVDLPDGDPDLTRFVLVDSTGRDGVPRREPLTGTAVRLLWSTPPEPPVVAVAIEKRDTALRVGAATVD